MILPRRTRRLPLRSETQRSSARTPERRNRSDIRLRWLFGSLLAAALPACDVPFQPYAENKVGPFSIFGYLDLKADTQWIRVSPVRQSLLSEPDPIDAVVTLEHVGNGRAVTLRDSLFSFIDPRLDAVGYAHNFWTTEPLEPEATYRLRAVRSDGAETTALIEMPPDLEISLVFFDVPESPGTLVPRQLIVEGERLLYTEVRFTIWDESVGRAADPVQLRQSAVSVDSARWGYTLPAPGGFGGPIAFPLIDLGRREAHVAIAGSDWPYEPGLSPTDIAIPGLIPSTVENGAGSVRGVATWDIPLALCIVLDTRPDDSMPCAMALDASSASVVGRVERDACSHPRELAGVRLTERFANGGAVVWSWNADWDGSYHFEGIRPGSNLRLVIEGYSGGPIDIAPLAPGERYVTPDVTVRLSC